MKLYKTILCALGLLAVMTACNDDDKNNTLSDADRKWADMNQEWLNEMLNKRNADGTPYFTKVIAPWNPDRFVLMHYCEDPKPNQTNLRPYFTSTVDVRYNAYFYNDTLLDTSADIISPVKGALRTDISSNGLIEGWKIALINMHVGDTCEIVVPYASGYGIQQYNQVKPYSNLRFNMRLIDVPYYVVKP